MEHRLLEYFLAVCEERHFTRAAEKLRISQPTLSQQIRLLEHRVGTPLFSRIGKKTYLTDAGEVLLKHSLNAFHELDQAQAAINEIRGMQRGRLRIGCSGNHLLTRTIVSFHRQYPGIELSVTELATEETKEGLLHNRLDLGVVFLPAEDEHLVNIPLYNEELQLVVAHDHEHAHRTSIALHELRHLPLLLLQEKFYVRRMFDECCRANLFTPTPILELSTLESLLQMALHKIGVAVLPKSYAAGLSPGSVISIPITDPIPQKTVGIVYRKEMFMCATMETFIRELTAHFQDSKKTP